MENNNTQDSSPLPSSFTDLFGVKDSLPTSASNALFSSIFAASTVASRNYSTSQIYGNAPKLHTGSRSLDAGFQGDMIKDKEDESNFIPSKETNSVFQERPETCPLSSSLYYGGKEDMYVRSSSPYTSGSPTNYKKDGGVDDSGTNNSDGVSRGNWWQGSLYY